MLRDDVEYEFDSIRIHPLNRTLKRGGEIVPLPSRAFDVLLLLIEKRGDVASKTELLTTIWPDTHVDETSLPVMISLLRRALGDDGRRQKYIQTVSKCGYRLIGEIKEILPAPAAPTVAYPAMHPLPPGLRYPHFKVATAGALALLAASFLAGSAGRNPVETITALPQSARTDAQTWYQKGRYAWNLQTKAGMLQSVEYYQKSIAENPAYAMAWAGLAESYISLPSYSQKPDEEELRRARVAATKAAGLDGSLADSHIALGMVSLIADRNFPGGEYELRRAVALNPNSPLAQGELALCLIAAGRTDEAVAHGRRAKELDPLSIRAATDLGIVLYYGHRFQEARAEFEEVLKLDPYSYRAHVNLGKTYLSLGRFDDARRVLEQAVLLSNHDPLAEGLTAEARALGGDVEGARSILAALEQKDRITYVAPISLAFAYAGLGRLNETLANLKKAHKDRAIAALYFKVDPNWEALHQNPDFRDLVKDYPESVQGDTGSDSK